MANEKRLIDAYKLEDLVRSNSARYHHADDVIAAITRQPTVDAVEVVRCKDCKHFGGHGACHCHAADENGTPIFVREGDFCSYGERME